MEVEFLREPTKEEIERTLKWSATSAKVLESIRSKRFATNAELQHVTGYKLSTVNAQISILGRMGLVGRTYATARPRTQVEHVAEPHHSREHADLTKHIWKAWVLQGCPSYYTTHWGSAYYGDALELLKEIESESVDLIMTSPPFALRRKKEYGNVEAEEYVTWFMPFAEQFRRVLRPEGNLVIHIGGGWIEGKPRKALYNFELLIALSRIFIFIQDFYWFNPAKLPTPAEWVTVRRIRAKDAVDPIWWFAKTDLPKADNRRVLKPYSESMLELFRKGYKPKLRPSGHKISDKFNRRHGGAIPPNILVVPNTDSNSRYLRMCREFGIKPNPARYPLKLPEFFIKFLTDKGDTVLDPFGGSNTTGAVAENLSRRWMCFEIDEEYLKGSIFRFDPDQIIASKDALSPVSQSTERV